MKRAYNFREIASDTGFEPDQVEKVCRISDILEDISTVPFLRERLSLYGGTALAFVYFDDVERLSVDIDFNYRHRDPDKDWGDVRTEIDKDLKKILDIQGYMDDAINITPTYPLCRFTIKYTNHLGRPDDFMIETGYMRRIPTLQSDTEQQFYHVGTRNTFKVKTPSKEELFGNKWCTMLYRGSPRDLFDVYRISQEKLDKDLFSLAAVMDSLMRGRPRLVDIEIEEKVRGIRFDSSLTNVLYSGNEYDPEEVHERVTEFSTKVIENLTAEEMHLIDVFYTENRLEVDILPSKNMLHADIESHPMIRRVLERSSKK